MAWTVIAKHDGVRTLESKPIRLLLYLLFAAVTVMAYIFPVFGPEPTDTAVFTGYVAGTLTTIIPLIGLVLGYNAVIEERVSGSIVLPLSMPHSRFDLVFGKAVGRIAVLAMAVITSLVVAGALVVYPFGEVAGYSLLGMIGLTVVFAAIWTGIGVAISVSVRGKNAATVLAFGLYVVLVLLWGTLESAVTFGLDSAGISEGDLPGFLEFIFDLEPGRLFERVVAGFLDPNATISETWYENEWAALLMLGLWLVLPLGIAFVRFARSDLR